MPTRRPKWRRYLLLLLGPGLVVGILVFLKFSQISLLMAKGAEAARAGPPPEAVGSALAQAQTWEVTLSEVGTVAGLKSVAVSNESPGRVKRIRFESGTTVKASQVLVELDTSVEQAELASARSALELARVNAERSRNLYAEQVAPRAQLDTDEANLQTAEKNVDAIRAEIERKVVRAPFAGRLGIREVDLGEYLAAGTTITALEEELGEVYVDFTLPQEELGRLHKGLPVRIDIEGPSPVTLQGVLSVVNPAVDNATRSVGLRASVRDRRELLRTGMFVRATLVLPSSGQVVTVPATAIVHAPYGDSVFVIEDKKPGSPGASTGPGGRPVKIARQQFVRVGESRGDFVAIEEGLEAGKQVVSAGAFKLRNGAPIVIDNRQQPDMSLNPRPENR